MKSRQRISRTKEYLRFGEGRGCQRKTRDWNSAVFLGVASPGVDVQEAGCINGPRRSWSSLG